MYHNVGQGPNSAALLATQNHPWAQAFLKLGHDVTALASRNNVRGMETNLVDLCTSFQEGLDLERAKLRAEITQSSSDIENTILLKELNSHKLNNEIEAPTQFSPIPTMTSPQRANDAIKMFPRVKYSGSYKDGSMTVMEYLSSLNVAQQQCKLSKPEFLDRLLASSTGAAHEFIVEWIQSGENVDTIYYNLLVNFDKRITPAEAKIQINNYKAARNTSLAKVESAIMMLAARAASCLPIGSSRTAYYNMEACNALTRALPTYSSMLANNMYNQVSAKLGRACTFAELGKGLNVFRVSIDSDVSTNWGRYWCSRSQNG
jgi:hypothetical protein